MTEGKGPPPAGPLRDGVVRAITDDGSFRVIAARTTDTVRAAAAAQGVMGATARRFAELMTGAVLVREAMAPQLRVQAILKGAAGGSLLADSHPDGATRGLVNLGGRKREAATTVDLGPGALLQVMRTLPNGAIHQGVVAAEQPGVEGALMAYLQESEQVVSVVGVCALDSGGEITAAGGFLVQLLPEVERGPLLVMTERLQGDVSLEAMLRGRDASPDAVLAEVLYGMPYALVGAAEVAFACHCSEPRLLASLATLPRSDIEEMLTSGETLEIRCDYCKRDYAIPAEALRAAVTTN